jgi:putative phage-type endonuclease
MLLSDLDELEDILDSLLPVAAAAAGEEEPFYFNEDEECDIIENVMQLMYEYVEENPCEVSEHDFHECMIESIKELYSPMIAPEIYSASLSSACFFVERDKIHDDFDELIDIAADLFYKQFMPPRSFPTTFVRCVTPSPEKLAFLKVKLDYLASKPQPQQRTDEWYKFRHNLITASNAFKAFENANTQNQLIYEKCQPIGAQGDKFSYVNVDTPFHWGQKYEPVSVMYYESEYNTRVGDFGCIQHDQFSFLGASPDGINNDPSRPHRFGRMLEIKNIVNREIDGIPKKEYWIQMQLQMETCDLDECDFLETRFQEYETEAEFLEDGDDFTKTEKGDWKGVIMYFSTPEGRPHYVYKPLAMDFNEGEKWCEHKMEELCKTRVDENGIKRVGMCWIKNIFWHLEEVSCVLVLRNKMWFNANIGQLERVWRTIEKERISGDFAHRAPNKRSKKIELPMQVNKIENYFNLGESFKPTNSGSGCLIPLPNGSNANANSSGVGNSYRSRENSLIDEEKIGANTVIKIRTESIDETKKLL